jgi:putative peptide zinc metalloprotease protein
VSALHEVSTTSGDGAQQAPPPDVPVRASGLELIGEIPGSGYRQPPALVRRADGQTIQLTRLLYLVLEAVDGERSFEEIAAGVGPALGRQVTGDNVRTLCDRLRTLGALKLADGAEPDLRRSNPLLALRFRYVVSDPEVTSRLTAPFARLFAPVIVVLVCAAFVAVCAWVLLEKGLASATHQAFDQPALLLGVFALTVVSAGFHEFGHAAAARYGGARPGAMGTGLYLVWPAFYTDVTDSYRLGRAGRVRTDLGGLYFNAIVAIAMFALWWATRWDAILLIIATQVLQMLRQLAPLVRFDGYHVLADITGVPDLYHRIKPTLLGLLPSRWKSAEASVLRPWARAVVTAWVLIVVPVLLATTVLMVLALPRLIGTAVASLGDQAELLGEQFGDGDALGVMVRLLSLVAIALPVLGTLYIIARVVRQVVTRTWRATDGRPGRRAVAGVAAMAVLAGLAWAWWPEPGAYRPIQAYERGAVQDALPTSLRGVAPASLVEGRGGRAQTIWPADVELPSADSPQLAVVLVPRGTTDGQQEPGQQGAGAAAGQEAPTWVFPFNRPLPPGEGDNQALAVNTTDGGTVYDVAFALVWADGDSVLNTNEAYALASCKECQTVAVAFQVVLVVGQVDVVVPQNLSAAVNYSCVECVTYALATQLVLSLPESLDPRSLAELEALWREIAAFGASLEGVPLSELQARLSAFEAQILEIVRTDPGAAPAGEPTDQATASAPADGQSGTTAPAATGGATAPRPSATTSAQEQEAAPTSTSTSSPVATVTSSPTATEEPTAAATATSTAAPETTAP